eukprot:2235271-Alexandrium_andersonii.AAC.1
MDEYIDKATTWENEVSRYENEANERIGDAIKTAVIIGGAPAELRDKVPVNIGESQDYAYVKNTLLQNVYSKTWKGEQNFGTSGSSGPVEVDALTKGKGEKGKGGKDHI